MARLILTRDNDTLKALFLTGTRMWTGSGAECTIRSDADAATRNPVAGAVIHLDECKLLFRETVPVPAHAWPAGR